MRILLLCDRFPDSYRDGLLLRVLHLVRHLRAQHAIELLCFHSGVPEGETVALFDRVRTVAPPDVRPGAGWLAPLLDWNPRQLYPHSSALAHVLEHELMPADYDVIWDAGASLFPHLSPRWRSVPLVADLVDDMVLTFGREARLAESWLQRARIWKYRILHWGFERYCMRRAAMCVVVSEEDAAMFRRVSPQVPVVVVANGVDVDYFAPLPVMMQPNRLVFEGSMAFPPNQDAAQFLTGEILPLIWRLRPDVCLTLVGRDPPPALQALQNERIQVTGAVPDVRPFVAEAALFVCPLRSGAGIKNKLLQAWAMGKAVVATPLSVGGLAAREGDNIVLREGAPALAEAVLELLDAPERCQALGVAARNTVLEQYTWSRQAVAFARILEQAARAGRE